MVQRMGGETPIVKYGLSLTVEAPAGTDATTPVLAGQVFKLSGTGADGTGYKVAAATAADDSANSVLVMALHDCRDINVPLGVQVITGWATQVRRIRYKTGSAPTIGQSIEIAAADVRHIVGQAFAAGCGYVLAVDTAAEDCEVLV